MRNNNGNMVQEVQNLDRQIETLMKCKPLPESEVKILCDKVFPIFKNREKIIFE